jgi:hypothetical protein
MEFRHSSPETLHTKRRERPLLAKDGTKARKFSQQSVIQEITKFFYMPQSWDMGHVFYFPSEGRHAWGFLPHRKNPTASAGIEPRGQCANH